MRALSARHSDVVERLVSEHQASVRGFLMYLGCPPHQVDDLVQDVFLTFLRTDFEHRSSASTRTFLRGVAKNLFLKAMRHERHRPPMTDLTVAERAWVEFEADDGGTRYLDALRDCLGSVKGRALSVLRLRYEQSLARAAIAHQLEMTESGVNSLLVRLRKRLRGCVEEKLA